MAGTTLGADAPFYGRDCQFDDAVIGSRLLLHSCRICFLLTIGSCHRIGGRHLRLPGDV